MRKSSAANKAASSPPVPARTSRMALRSSASSLGSSMSLICCSSAGMRDLSCCSSSAARARISASPASSASTPSSTNSVSALRKASTASTIGERSLYSLDSLAKLPDSVAGADMMSRSSAWRRTSRSSVAANEVRPDSAMTLAEPGEMVPERRERHGKLFARIEVPHGRGVAREFVLAKQDGGARGDLVGPLQPAADIAGIALIDGKAGAAQILGQTQGRQLRRLADRNNGDRPRQSGGLVDQHGQTFDPGRPADARRLGAAHHPDQPVIAAAAHHRALRSEIGGYELEGGMAVIVEAAHEARVYAICDAEGIEPTPQRVKECARVGIKMAVKFRRI